MAPVGIYEFKSARKKSDKTSKIEAITMKKSNLKYKFNTYSNHF
jgi:hypothetical protein